MMRRNASRRSGNGGGSSVPSVTTAVTSSDATARCAGGPETSQKTASGKEDSGGFESVS